MKTGHYAVVRYIADPARNEALNVGIVLWDDTRYRLQIDDGAARRALRDNPRIAADALVSLREALDLEIAGFQQRYTSIDTSIREWVDAQRGFPVAISDARFVALDDSANGERDAHEVTMSRLIARIVRPVRSSGYRRSSRGTALWALRQAFMPLVEMGKVVQKYQFDRSQSGIPRQVDFFANHGANTAFEAFRSGRGTPGDIIAGADAEAHKIEDIRAIHPELQFLVFFPVDEQVAALHGQSIAREQASRVLVSAGAQLVKEIAEAQREMQAAMSHE